jgi:nucleotide-binding universal stress UspA family protein
VKHTITHILVPIDFSGYSNRAFRFAVGLAEKADAKVILFHVVEPPYNFATAVKGMLDMMEKNALSRMKKMIDDADSKIDIETQIRHGRTSREILECADRESADMVVMGSRGQSALSRAVLGSVSEKIAHELPIPLFLIPESTEKTKISSLIFATDFRINDPAFYLYASAIAGLIDASVTLVHFSPNFNFEARIRHLGFTEILRKETGDDSLTIEIVVGESLLHGIAEFIAHKDVSGIVFNRYKKSVLQKLFQKDHTGEIVVGADLPLLIIPSVFQSDSEK